MACAEKLQRLLMAAVLGLSWFLLSIGSIYGSILMGFIILMVIVWAMTDFCPSIWFFAKLFGRCKTSC